MRYKNTASTPSLISFKSRLGTTGRGLMQIYKTSYEVRTFFDIDTPTINSSCLVFNRLVTHPIAGHEITEKNIAKVVTRK